MWNFLKALPIFVLVLAVFALIIWFSGGTSYVDDVGIAEDQIGMGLDSQRVDVGEVTLHVVFAGPEDGKPVILMHGFPEFWFAWRHQIKPLAEAGYRVAVPDLRGYNRSDKPAGVKNYTQRKYAGDMLGLMDSQGWDSANIVAHDIGAGVAWRMIFEHPDRVMSAVIFSVGHPLAFQAVGNESDVSWYRSFLKLPILPELLMRTYGPTLIKNSLRDTSRPGTFSDDDLSVYEQVWDRDHAMDTMINAYRAENPPIDGIPEDGEPNMLVSFVFGAKDAFISLTSAERSQDFMSNVLIHPELGHWLIAEEPEEMAKQILFTLSLPDLLKAVKSGRDRDLSADDNSTAEIGQTSEDR